MKAFLSFFSLFTIIGCKHTETKRIASTFPNGQVAEFRYYNDAGDTLTYRKEEFYNYGAKAYIGEIVNGKKNGVWIWWYANGIKKDQCKYANGFVIDTVYHWYKSGTIKQIEIVHKGKDLVDSCGGCNATIIRYYENGNKKEMFTDIDEISQDSSKTWYENGQLESMAIISSKKKLE